MKQLTLIISTILLSLVSLAEDKGEIRGTVDVRFERYEEVPLRVYLEGTPIFSTVDEEGHFSIADVPFGEYVLVLNYPGVLSKRYPVILDGPTVELSLVFDNQTQTLDEVEIMSDRELSFGISHMPSVDGMAIYAGKKSEYIKPSATGADLASNSGRQVFAKVTGVNVWESDGNGLQMGIGTRGLSPNRTANVNTRQNGYDIAADALGYPESYYTPPMEAISGIEVVKGAATLQYGTQFGGMVNFRLKNQDVRHPWEVETRQTVNSFGQFNTFNSIGRKSGKHTFYGYVNYKTGSGWRPNSQFDYVNAFASYKYQFNRKTAIGFEYSKMQYLAQQPGGLTDAMFEEDPRQSIRERNWFRVNWNILAANFTHRFNPKWRMEVKPFALINSKDALGILTFINRADPLGKRDYYRDEFRNFGIESRAVHTYKLGKAYSNLLFGFRMYRGDTRRMQGLSDDGYGPNFSFNDPDHLAYGDYTFPSRNAALFAENVFQISPSFSITPGVRYEYISTAADGYYNFEATDLAGNVIERRKIQDSAQLNRDFVLFGIGLSKKFDGQSELYGNFSQNYRAVTFNDLKASVPNLRVDPDLKDETGYTIDLGIRKQNKTRYIFDINGFMMVYNNRIGAVLQKDERTYQVYRYRTNISDSRTLGLEGFGEVNIIECSKSDKSPWCVSVFGNVSWMHATYTGSDEAAFTDKVVELVPSWNVKSGLKVAYKDLTLNSQVTYLTQQFTDATNAEITPNAINGLIPSYYVVDMALSYKFRDWFAKVGVNNVTNHMYFTRRANGYPGPGIIPSDGRNVYLSLSYKWHKAK